MKTLLASLLLLTAPLCFADVAVYEGFQFGKTISSVPASSGEGKVFEVVDLANSQIVTITLNSHKHVKTFSVGAPVSVVITDVPTPHRSATVLANASTTTDATTGVTTIASLMQSGRDANVIINGTTATSLPRLLEGHSSTVTTAGTGSPAIAPTFTEQEVSLALKVKDSLTSNNAGDTLSAAVARITASLIAKGFTAAP